MSLVELRLALGVTEALLNEALWLLTFPGNKRITYPTPGQWHWARSGGNVASGRKRRQRRLEAPGGSRDARNRPTGRERPLELAPLGSKNSPDPCASAEPVRATIAR